VEGHTDDQPPTGGLYVSNWDLSSARAGATARVLEEYGIGKERLIAIGHGETRPVGDNATPEGRAQNRRVEIWIVNPDPIGPQLPPSPVPVAGNG
jgi:chemotaxis protein MotB